MAGPVVTISSTAESMSSIELEARAKGAPKITVKVYVMPGDEEAGADKAESLFRSLEQRFAHMNDGSTPVRQKQPPVRGKVGDPVPAGGLEEFDLDDR